MSDLLQCTFGVQIWSAFSNVLITNSEIAQQDTCSSVLNLRAILEAHKVLFSIGKEEYTCCFTSDSHLISMVD